MSLQQEHTQFYKKINEEKWSPFYFLYGDEEYLIHRATKFLLGRLIAEDLRDFNLHQYYPDTIQVEKVLDDYEMYPMMSSFRVLVIKEVQNLSDSTLTQILQIFKKPISSSVVLFLAQAVDKRKKNIKYLIENAESVEFKKPYDNQIPQWIKYLAEENGLQMESSAVHAFHQKVNTSLRSIENEIQKIKDYCSGETGVTEITEEVIHKVIGQTHTENAFQLIEQWMSKKLPIQFQVIEELINNNESDLGFLQLLARHIRILIILKKCVELNESKDVMCRKAQLPNYFIDKYLKQANLWELGILLKILSNLSEIELGLKKYPALKKSTLTLISGLL